MYDPSSLESRFQPPSRTLLLAFIPFSYHARQSLLSPPPSRLPPALICTTSSPHPVLLPPLSHTNYCSKQFGPLVVAFVGLPARGKTVTGNKLARYLNWTGETAKVFVASEYRRKLVDRYDSHDLFRADNMEAMAIRRKSSVSAMEDATHWLNSEGNIAILDATNTTRDHRQAVYNYFVSQLGFKLLFVEFVVEDEEILSRNIKEVLMNSPDYKDMAMEKALDDFEQKVQHYMEQYETMSSSQDKLYSFLRILNQGVILVMLASVMVTIIKECVLDDD
uniref:6-phosphofructo-2-kinase domain-containing protein n=1 Tax=Timema monikensis TaxID=170555 RepID=A0A7R9ELB9_9NEOP|nr:unnamed protein product [Timema monikensis]